MDAKLKAKWVEALRGGNFRQAREQLCIDSRTLCCIGVGAVVADPEFKPNRDNYTREASIILGITDEQQEKLVSLNDEDGYSFEEIADYIEANL